MNVSFAVQAHPARTEAAEALAASMGGEVVYDPEPAAALRSPWRTFRHLMAATPPGATHRLQIQDDALTCPGFREAVEAAVAARPDRLLVFHVGRNPDHHARAVLDACARDESWARLPYAHWVPVVCTCWPAGLAQDLLKFVDAQGWAPSFTADDEIVGRFVRHAGVAPLASVPSLAEHPDGPSVNRSRLTRERRGRRAACWIGDCQECAAGIDWTRGPD